MVQARKLSSMLLGGLLAVMGCATPPGCGERDLLPPVSPVTLSPVATPAPAVSPDLPAVPVTPAEERPLPINLPTALQLAHVRAVDIAAASERIQVAAALLQQAQALWLPTVSIGADYFRHDGPIQDVSNVIFNDSHSSTMLGVGTGVATGAVVTVTDAVFAPLVAKQRVRADEANRQAAANDTLLAVTDAYFTVQQARGELAGAMAACRRTEDLLARTRKLAPAIVPDLELFRAETELARCQKAELLARERWQVAGAELVRVLRLDAAVQVEPAEPPHLRLELIDLHKPLEQLIPMALTLRPELASQQAQVQATLAQLRQEHWRPLLPSVVLRGSSTPSGTLAGGVFFPSPFGSTAGMRGDVDVQLLWQLNNLGFGNVGLVHQRQAENRAAMVELARIEDRVAAEVAQAHAQAVEAGKRVEVAERGLRFATLSADKNLAALSQTKGVGNQQVLLVRPQEVVAAIQDLAQAYVDFYGAIADANRAQFRLYHALGQPADSLVQQDSIGLKPGTLSAPPEHWGQQPPQVGPVAP